MLRCQKAREMLPQPGSASRLKLVAEAMAGVKGGPRGHKAGHKFCPIWWSLQIWSFPGL